MREGDMVRAIEGVQSVLMEDWSDDMQTRTIGSSTGMQ